MTIISVKSIQPAASTKPDVIAKESDPGGFRACDEIAKFYDAHKTPSRTTQDLFGGRSFTWFVTDHSQAYQVSCRSDLKTVGLGQLSITSRMASVLETKRSFIKSSPVDPETSVVSLTGVLGQIHHIRLPVPDSSPGADKSKT